MPTLSLAEATARARSESLVVRRAALGVETAATVDDERRALWRPGVAVQSSYTLFDHESVFEIPNVYAPLVPYLSAASALDPTLPPPDALAAAVPDPEVVRYQHDVRAAVAVTQPVYIAAARPLRAVAAASVAEADAGTEVARDSVEQGTVALYFAALTQLRLVEVAERALELSRLAHRRVAAAAREGVAEAFEVTRAEVAVARAERDVSAARSSYALARDALAELLDLPPTFDVCTDGLDLAASPPADTSAGEVAAEARWVAAAERHEALTDVSRAEAAPVLVARASATAQRPTAFAEATEWSLTVALQWEPYSGGRRRIEMEREQLAAAEARLAAETEANASEGELRRQRIRVDDAQRAVEQADRELSLAVRGVEVTRAAWEAGAASWVDVEAAEEQRELADAAAAIAAVQRLAAQAELSRQLSARER
ncbi:MAG: TolC family protein [Myxococcales bacterium]|nr:TolC family protein [Myxococcales bacterium]